MKLFIYTRVSHKNSAKSGISTDSQIQLCKQYGRELNPDAEVQVHSDNGISGWSKPFHKRPAGKEILSQIERGDHIIFYSICRSSRNLRDFCNMVHSFEKRGVSVHFIENQMNTTTATGKLQMSIMAAIAQHYSDIISERTKEALLVKRIREGKEKQPRSKSKHKRFSAPSQYREAPKGPASVRLYGRVYQYERVSSESQYISGLSLEHQTTANRKAAERIAKETGGVVGEVFSDPAISAYKIPFHKRPAGRKLIEALKPGDDIVVYRMDRAFRSVPDALATIEMIREKGAYIHFVCEGIRTDSGAGREWLSLLASIAEIESSIKSRRLIEIAQRARETGRPTSNPNKGLKIQQVSTRQKKLTINKKEALELAFCWVLNTEYGLGPTRVYDCLIALRARQLRVDANLKMKAKRDANRLLNQAKKLKELAGDSLWAKYLQEAREAIKQPFTKGETRLIRWEHPLGKAEETIHCLAI